MSRLRGVEILTWRPKSYTIAKRVSCYRPRRLIVIREFLDRAIRGVLKFQLLPCITQARRVCKDSRDWESFTISEFKCGEITHNENPPAWCQASDRASSKIKIDAIGKLHACKIQSYGVTHVHQFDILGKSIRLGMIHDFRNDEMLLLLGRISNIGSKIVLHTMLVNKRKRFSKVREVPFIGAHHKISLPSGRSSRASAKRLSIRA